MNIIFLSIELPYPDNSGGRKYTWQRLKQLKQHDNDIYLYAFKENYEVLEDIEIKKVCKEINTYEINKSIKNIISNANIPYHVAIFKSDKLCNDIKDKIKDIKVDCIIIDIPQLIPNCPFDNNIPKILTQHNIEYNLFKTIAENNKSLKKIIWYTSYLMMKHFENSFYKKNFIKGYVFISENDMRYFKNKYPDSNCICIPQAIEDKSLSNIKFQENKSEKIIVFTGKMDYLPNVQGVEWFVKKVFPIIEKEISEIKFFIVGKNPTEEVRALANSNIVVTGIVDNVEKYIQFADLVVLPLISGGGVKIKLFEALQNNKLIVTTSKGIEGTKFKHKVHLLVSDDESIFAKYCINMLKYPSEYSSLKINAIDLINNEYTNDKIGLKYNDFIKNVIFSKLL